MRRSAEQRLLLALLLCSLLPLVALGCLAALGMLHLGRELERVSAEAALREARARASRLAAEAADRVSRVLLGSRADLRMLCLLPPDPNLYAQFCRTRLAPVRVLNGGEQTVIWPPLFREVRYEGARGIVRGTPSGPVGYAPASLSLPIRPPAPWIPRLEYRPLPGPDRGRFPRLAGLELVMELPGAGGASARLVAVLDGRHLQAALGSSGAPPETGSILVWAGPGNARYVLGREGFPQETVTAVAAHAVGPSPRVLPVSSGWVAAAHPLPGPDSDSPEYPFAAVVALVPRPSSPAAAAVRTLSRRYELYAVLLTLCAAGGLGFAAFLVARRITRPWMRLRDKARSLAPETARERADDVAVISESFDALARRVAEGEGRLRASEERLREFFEMTPDGIAVLDAQGRLLHFNRALCQMLRRSPIELEGAAIEQVVAEPGAWSTAYARLRERGRLRNYELPLLRADRTSFPALLTLRLSTSDQGERTEIIVRDISEIKEAQRRDRQKTETLFRVYGELSQAHEALRRAYDHVEEQVRQKTRELEDAYRALQAADRVKTEFLMQMSHELRTPLNCIIGYSEAMIDGLDGPVTEEQARSLRRIAESGRRLLRLIENLLDLSRLEAGRMEFVPREIRVEETLEAILHQARSLVGERPVRLELALQEPLPAVWADPDRLAQVVFNLVGNAVKFTEKGTVRVEARQRDAQLVEVSVSDTGPGIPPDQQVRIFDKFVKATGNRRQGAGLGLAICREIVERMGGTIRLESEPGRGSTFRFTVPVADARACPAKEPVEPVHSAG